MKTQVFVVAGIMVSVALMDLVGTAEQTDPGPTRQPIIAESETAELGLTYGKSTDLSLPKTILFSASPEEIVADAEEWSRRGITAFFVNYVAREWSSDIWAKDGKPWTIGESDETFQKTKEANAVCKRIGSDTFLKIAFDNPFEWFNDIAWQHINHNFRQFAIFARETDCTGIAIDIEYVSEQYQFEWEGYTYDGYTRQDLVGKIRDRMTAVIQILYDEFPDMVFLTFPEEGLTLGSVIHVAWIEEAARRNAPGGVHYCTEYTYRNPNIRYMFGHGWACNDLFHRLLSDHAKRYWREKCSIAAGVWPFGFNYQQVYDPGISLEEFRQAYAASLMMSSRYNWIYSHNCRELLIGRAVSEYKGDADIEAYLRMIADKEIVTTPNYVALAKELRGMVLRDFTNDLGVMPAPQFFGPSDRVSVGLIPATSYSSSAHIQARDELWDLGLKLFAGADVNLRDHFGTQTHWMLIGPFENDENWSGHDAVYPPETEIDLDAEYDGLAGKVRWIEHRQEGRLASVDLTKVFEPTEHVSAYGLCYVTSPRQQEAQIRVGTNDSGKLWFGGRPVYDYPQEGSAILDRDIVPVTIPKGTTPILIKASNGEINWGFVFRITDETGKPLQDIRFSPRPPG